MFLGDMGPAFTFPGTYLRLSQATHKMHKQNGP